MMGFIGRTINGLLCLTLSLSLSLPALAQTASIIPPGQTQYFDANGTPLAGGSVYYYLPTTTTPKSTWSDAFQTTLQSNPITLDSAGRTSSFGQGPYRQIVKDASGNLIWDAYTIAPAVSSGSAGTSSAPTQVGCNNCGVKAAAASSNITFTLTDSTGAPLSSSDTASACFSVDSASQTSVTCSAISSALTFSMNSGSTLGVTGTTQAFRAWIVLFYNAGTPVLGLINATNYTTLGIKSLDGLSSASSSACNACAGATSSQTFYTTSAVSSSPYIIIAYAEFAAFAVNGHWVAPTSLHSCYWGCKTPGSTVQVVTASTGTQDSGTTSATYATNTAMEITITPTSAANLIRATMSGSLTGDEAGARVIRGTSGNNVVGFLASNESVSATKIITPTTITGYDNPSTTSSQIYAGQRVSGDGNTVRWPDSDWTAAATHYGYMTLEEIQG